MTSSTVAMARIFWALILSTAVWVGAQAGSPACGDGGVCGCQGGGADLNLWMRSTDSRLWKLSRGEPSARPADGRSVATGRGTSTWSDIRAVVGAMITIAKDTCARAMAVWITTTTSTTARQSGVLHASSHSGLVLASWPATWGLRWRSPTWSTC
ncbi:unnamed protein product [Lampetra planeri]